MTEAWIIDACRTPRGIGKVGKGALAELHPQVLGATVLRALAERNGLDTGDVDDIVWGTSMQVGTQGGDLGRMAALDAGYAITASGVTLDRFCGSGISVGQLRRRLRHGRHGGRGHRRRHGDDVVLRRQRRRSRARPSSTAATTTCGPSTPRRTRASPPTPSPRWRRSTAGPSTSWRRSRSAGPRSPSRRVASTGRLVPVHNLDGTVALDREEYPRPGTTADSLASLPSSFEALADIPLDEDGTTYRSLVLQKFPGLEIDHVHHAGNSSGVVDGAAALLMTSPDYATAHGLRPRARIVATANIGDDPTLMLNAPVPATRKVLAKAGMSLERHRPVRGQRGLRRRAGEVHPRPRHRPREDQRQRRRHRPGPPHRGHRLAPGRHGARRARAPGQAGRPDHHVRRRRHGARR